MLLESTDIGVHDAHIPRIQDDESFFRVKAQGQNILDILVSHLGVFIQISSILMEVFLVVSYLNDEGHIKGFLHIFAEDEWKHVTQVQSF